jgi:hypothetical protein
LFIISLFLRNLITTTQIENRPIAESTSPFGGEQQQKEEQERRDDQNPQEHQG